MTIEGAKEQEDRTWSQIIELDREEVGMSKNEESEGQGSKSGKIRKKTPE